MGREYGGLDSMDWQTDSMCSSCKVRPNRGLTWTGKLYFGQETTLEGLCVVCAAHGPERTTPYQLESMDCGCSVLGRCSYHAAARELSAEDVRGWQSVGELWDWERALDRKAALEGVERTLIVEGDVAGRVAGSEDVKRIAWLPDGRAEVTFMDKTAGQSAPAVLVPVGLMTTDEEMRAALVNRETWTRWQWRGDAHKSQTAREVCRECGATWGVKRQTAHKCGETVDSRGRARLDPETRRRGQVARAALGRARLALRLGREVSASDVAAIEAGGYEVPAV